MGCFEELETLVLVFLSDLAISTFGLGLLDTNAFCGWNNSHLIQYLVLENGNDMLPLKD